MDNARFGIPAIRFCRGSRSFRKLTAIRETHMAAMEANDFDFAAEFAEFAGYVGACQSAFKFDPASASNFDPFGRRVLAVALAPSELVGVAETVRARAA